MRWRSTSTGVPMVPTTSPPDDSLRQLEVMEAEGLHALVEIEHLFGEIVQREELGVAAVEIVGSKAGLLQLLKQRFAEARADVQQGNEAGRVEAAAVPQAGADDVVVVGRDGFKDVEQVDGIVEQAVGAAQEARGIVEIAAFDQVAGAGELP